MKKKLNWAALIVVVSSLVSGCLGDYSDENTPTPYQVILPLPMMTVDGWKFTLTNFSINELDDNSQYEYFAEITGILEKFTKGNNGSGCLPSRNLYVLIQKQNSTSGLKINPLENTDYCVNNESKRITVNYPIESLRGLADSVGPFAYISLALKSRSNESIYIGQLGHLGDPSIIRASDTPTPSYDGFPSYPIMLKVDYNGGPLKLEISKIDLFQGEVSEDLVFSYDLINESEMDICLRPEDFFLRLDDEEIIVYESLQDKYEETFGLPGVSHRPGICVDAGETVSSYLVFEVSYEQYKYDRAFLYVRNSLADLGFLIYVKEPAPIASIPTETIFPSRTPEDTPTPTNTATPMISLTPSITFTPSVTPTSTQTPLPTQTYKELSNTTARMLACRSINSDDAGRWVPLYEHFLIREESSYYILNHGFMTIDCRGDHGNACGDLDGYFIGNKEDVSKYKEMYIWYVDRDLSGIYAVNGNAIGLTTTLPRFSESKGGYPSNMLDYLESLYASPNFVTGAIPRQPTYFEEICP